MYCRNCGNKVTPQAILCVECGSHPTRGKNFCQNCGAKTNVNAEMCVKCGARLAVEGKDWLTALLLCIFLGGLGIHRFYTGSIGLGILQLVTLGGCGIWTLIDIILIATGSFRDGNGRPLVNQR